VFPRDVVCLRNISVDTQHKGDTEDDDDDDNNNNNNNNNNNSNSNNNNNNNALKDLRLVHRSGRNIIQKAPQ